MVKTSVAYVRAATPAGAVIAEATTSCWVCPGSMVRSKYGPRLADRGQHELEIDLARERGAGCNVREEERRDECGRRAAAPERHPYGVAEMVVVSVPV
jgi:hypothetical protein